MSFGGGCLRDSNADHAGLCDPPETVNGRTFKHCSINFRESLSVSPANAACGTFGGLSYLETCNAPQASSKIRRFS